MKYRRCGRSGVLLPEISLGLWHNFGGGDDRAQNAAIIGRALELGICREKALMLEHMILAHHYEPEFGSPKKPLFPEAEVLHYLDILDARMFDMQDALEGTEPGGFSDRIWTLDNRKLYKPTEGTF